MAWGCSERLNSRHLSGKIVVQHKSLRTIAGDVHVAVGPDDKSAIKKGTPGPHNPDWALTIITLEKKYSKNDIKNAVALINALYPLGAFINKRSVYLLKILKVSFLYKFTKTTGSL